MKKYFLPLLLILFLASCSDDIKTNSPGIQAQTDFGYFHTLKTEAYTNDDGTITIHAKEGSKVLNLTVESVSSNSEHELGGQSLNVADYTSNDGVFYSTDSLGEGMIRIKSADSDGIYGSFHFNARINGHTGDTLNFSQGAFFAVPMVDGSLEGQPDLDLDGEYSEDCTAAMIVYSSKLSDFITAQMDEESSEVLQEKCAAFKQALGSMLEICGDEMDEETYDAFNFMYEEVDCSAEYWDQWDGEEWDWDIDF